MSSKRTSRGGRPSKFPPEFRRSNDLCPLDDVEIERSVTCVVDVAPRPGPVRRP
jgi:hypothetical protein